jgi:hypothetical protein
MAKPGARAYAKMPCGGVQCIAGPRVTVRGPRHQETDHSG